MFAERQAAHHTTTSALRLTIPILAALMLAGFTSCGGGGGGGSSSPPSNPVPSITTLSPSSATAGAAAQTLTINGANFLPSSTVTYNGVSHTMTFVSSTQVTIELSASDQTTAGYYAVVVTNPTPGGGPSNSVNFAVALLMPTFSTTPAQNGAVILTMSSPATGAAVYYTINGTTPTTSSPVFQTPMLISSNLTINAIAAGTGLPSSSVAAWTPSTAVAPGALVWSDEFTNTTGANIQPNPAVWTYDTGDGGWGNSELEDYCGWDSSVSPCDPTNPNVYVGTDGYLHIVAEQPSAGVYTSARMKSEGLFSILYGRVEASIMVPEAQGFWPAFWMLGNNIVTDGWPACGEDDIQERIDAAGNPDWNAGSIHGTGFTGANLGTTYDFPSGQTAATWHSYGMIWQPGSIQYYIDDPTNIYATYTPASLNSLPGAVWPFDSGNAEFFIVNLAVGGSWPGPPNASTPFPSPTLVDYIRVYAYGSAAPAIAALVPSSLPAGASPQTLVIKGSGFLTSSAVTLNGIAHTPTFVSPTQLTIHLTASDLATVSSLPVVVTNPSPGGGASKAVNFIVTAAGGGSPVASITLLPGSLSAGPGGSVNISPTSPTVPEGGAQAFTASVVGSVNGVAWSVQEGAAGGTIAHSAPNSAIYVPPNVTGTFHVVATSLDNPAHTAIAEVAVVAAIPYEIIHTFGQSSSSVVDGTSPQAGVIQATDGSFYGTTLRGGTYFSLSNCGNGDVDECGVVFKIDSSGNEGILHSFGLLPDGATPSAPIIRASDGYFYGTTAAGGISAECQGGGLPGLLPAEDLGCGTVFKMDSSGNVTVLHSFTGAEGSAPFGKLIRASDGYFYGTTATGGTSSNCPGGCGTIFKMDSSGNLTVLHSFTGADGELPFAGLIQASDGNFYGTASLGGPGNAGIVFKMDSSGSLTLLHAFAGAPDAARPFAPLVQGSDGYLYGTTALGGNGTALVEGGDGTVFRIDLLGNLTVLYSFTGYDDGAHPRSGLIQASDGYFYGTAGFGGHDSVGGTIFKMDATGSITVLHSFSGADGSNPLSSVLQAKDGNLYGTAQSGGANSVGVFYRLELPASF